MVRDEVVGVLDCQSDRINHFDSETIDLLTLFSTQASIALQNARLYSLEQQRARQLQAINAIAQQTTAVLDLEELLGRVCQLIQDAFRVSHVSLFLREDHDLVLRAHHGTLTPRIPEGGRFAANAEPWASILADSRTAMEKDFRQRARRQILRRNGFAHVHSAGFIRTDLGVLALDSAKADAFRDGDQQSLESVADICATAIQNAHYVDRVKQLAYLDGLTGIFNRRFFELRIMEEIERARRYGTGMAVIMADIDEFKRLNDEFGHVLGDEVLRQVSSLFHQQVRKVDVVCRYGGEEFGILLTQVNRGTSNGCRGETPQDGGRLAVPGRAPHGNHQRRRCRFSANMAPPAMDWLGLPITALYAAKQAGRNAVCLASAATARRQGSSCRSPLTFAPDRRARFPASLPASDDEAVPSPAAISGDSFPVLSRSLRLELLPADSLTCSFICFCSSK